jgi:hypothetical protein
MSRWITNLESTERLQADVKNAEFALKQAKDSGEGVKQATHMLSLAKFRLADNRKTMREIENENAGRISVGPPMGTPYKTAEDIAKDGIIGIYRQGAGDGPAVSFKAGE